LLFIFFVIASQKTEGIDWLVTQPPTNFGGKQARSGESSFRPNWGWRNAQVMICLLSYACYDNNTRAVGSTSEM